LPGPQPRGEDVNMHRLCVRTKMEDHATDVLELRGNPTDFWWIGEMTFELLREDAKVAYQAMRAELRRQASDRELGRRMT